MEEYTLNDPTVKSILKSLVKHPEFDKCDPVLIEQELDVPVASMEEEEEGFFMARTDRVQEIVGAMRFLISEGYVEGRIKAEKDRFLCSGISLTTKGRAINS